MTLDSLLQSLPKQIIVHDIVVMNVTFVGNPILSNSSIELDINGLFATSDGLVPNLHLKELSEQGFCNPSAKMIEMSLHENVFNSLSSVLFDVSFMCQLFSFCKVSQILSCYFPYASYKAVRYHLDI